MIARKRLLALAALACSLALPAAAQADFGLVPGSASVTARTASGTIDTQASSHPAGLTVHFELKTDESGRTEGGQARNIIVDLPAGLIGNPRAVPACPRQAFDEGALLPDCPGDTQVGFLRAIVPSAGGQATGPVFNLVPPPGVAAELGFSTAELVSHQLASTRTEEGYGLRVDAINTPIELSAITETIWGIPAAAEHDPERSCLTLEGVVFEGCPSTAPLRAFLTMPASCKAAPQTTISVDSVQDPTTYSSETVKALNAADQPQPMTGCAAVPFTPEISSQPTTKLASNPSGLDFELKLSNQGLTNPNGIAETEPKKVVVSLPEGTTVNPSFAEGVATCSEAQYRSEQLDSPAGAGCPEASKLGSVHVLSPLLEEPVEGSLYLAAPYENEFGTLAALYMVARAPERGILVKQAGRIDLNPSTGQITTTFDELPPIPFTSFKLHFREGARAPLATPQSCGEYKTVAKLTPFSSSEAITREASFQVERGAEGGACPSGGLPPFHPGLIAGSINNAAGRFSPFNVRLFRSDAEQEINRFSIKLPPGVVGKLAGSPSARTPRSKRPGRGAAPTAVRKSSTPPPAPPQVKSATPWSARESARHSPTSPASSTSPGPTTARRYRWSRSPPPRQAPSTSAPWSCATPSGSTPKQAKSSSTPRDRTRSPTSSRGYRCTQGTSAPTPTDPNSSSTRPPARGPPPQAPSWVRALTSPRKQTIAR